MAEFMPHPGLLKPLSDTAVMLLWMGKERESRVVRTIIDLAHAWEVEDVAQYESRVAKECASTPSMPSDVTQASGQKAKLMLGFAYQWPANERNVRIQIELLAHAMEWLGRDTEARAMQMTSRLLAAWRVQTEDEFRACVQQEQDKAAVLLVGRTAGRKVLAL